jgi:hypothetical protein
MERPPMFMFIVKAIYIFNVIPINLNSCDILHRNRKKHPKIHKEAQKIPSSQSNPEQKKRKNNARDINYLILNYTSEP